MLVEVASYGWASAEDIPGSRCGPEDGPWPRAYQVLSENDVWRELRSLARPQTFVLEGEPEETESTPFGVPPPREKIRADCVNFQPSSRTRTQDRYVVRDLEVRGRMWTLSGVFDGHLGDATVEHVAYHLPVIIQDFLGNALLDDPRASPTVISDALVRAIVAFDETLAQDVLDLFGGALEDLESYTDAEIRSIINDQHEGGANWQRVRLCMYGTTALVALVDPDRENLWVANLGDCQAVIVSQDGKGNQWTVERLTTEHNGGNDAELERVRRAHPGEPECIVNHRVLGALAPTRCLGDMPFKQPAAFTRRILYNIYPGFHDVSPWEEFLKRNHTPPYISTVSEVTHRRLDDYNWEDDEAGRAEKDSDSPYHDPSVPMTPNPRQHFPRRPRFLVLSSDGFSDLCGSDEEQCEVLESWARSVAQDPHGVRLAGGCSPVHGVTNLKHQVKSNMALRLLKEALGGEDTDRVSRVLTLDMNVAWIDDTAIMVQTL